MTWTKLSDDFGDDCARFELSDAAFRTHVEGLLWTNRRETDGRLSARDLLRFAESLHRDTAVDELVGKGLWHAFEGGGWQLVHHVEHQIEHVVLESRRRKNAESQRRARAKKASLDRGESPRPVSPEPWPVVTPEGEVLRVIGDVSRDESRDPGRVGTGRDGPGRVRQQEGEEKAAPGEEFSRCAADDCAAIARRRGADLVYGRPVFCEEHQPGRRGRSA